MGRPFVKDIIPSNYSIYLRKCPPNRKILHRKNVAHLFILFLFQKNQKRLAYSLAVWYDSKAEYGSVSKWGRLRAPPVADKASKKEWQRSKFGESTASNKFWAPQQDITALLQYIGSIPTIKQSIRKRIEVVITALTRNQVVLTGSWVRIPPLPPMKTATLLGGCFRLERSGIR